MNRGAIACLVAAVALSAPSLVVADDIVSVRYGWSAPGDCGREAALDDVAVSVDPATRRETVYGRLRRLGADPIRGVTVCFGNACATLARGDVIHRDQVATFVIEGIHGASVHAAKVRCSVLEARAGA